MTKIDFARTAIILILATQTTCQIIDFFSGFNTFLQPYQSIKTTTRRPKQQTNQQFNPIFFRDDEYVEKSRTVDSYRQTSAKPRKSRPKSTTRSWFDNFTEATTKKNKNASRNERIQSRPSNYDYLNSFTTFNPLLTRPGVKPALVDESKPPITNRPVTKRPSYDRPIVNNNNNNNRPVIVPNLNNRPANNDRNIVNNNPLSNNNNRPTQNNDNPSYNNNRPTQTNNQPSYNNNRPTSNNNNPSYNNNRPTQNNNQPTSNNNRPTVNNEADIEEPEIEIGPDEDDMSEAEKRRYYEIAERKCDQYKSKKIKKVVALPLAPTPQVVELNVSSCTPVKVPLIIGGTVVKINEFPHMSLVGWKKAQSSGYSWKCGGSLISDQYILTAGHCTYHDKDYNVISGPPHAVQLGSSYFDDPSATIIKIATVIRHPKYKLRRSYHDVALIKLSTVIRFSEVMSPACLGIPPSVGESIIATGWGKTEMGGESSVQLRSVSVPIWNMAECQEIWGTSRKLPNGPLPDNQLCAGTKGKDTCQGDSGGPAQIQDGCVWRIVAITSVGRSCGAPETPALYAKLPRAFISKQVFGDRLNNQDTGNNNRDTGNNNVYSNSNNDRDNSNTFSSSTSNNREEFHNSFGSNNVNVGSSNNNRGSGNNNANSGSNAFVVNNSNKNQHNEDSNTYYSSSQNVNPNTLNNNQNTHNNGYNNVNNHQNTHNNGYNNVNNNQHTNNNAYNNVNNNINDRNPNPPLYTTNTYTNNRNEATNENAYIPQNIEADNYNTNHNNRKPSTNNNVYYENKRPDVNSFGTNYNWFNNDYTTSNYNNFDYYNNRHIPDSYNNNFPIAVNRPWWNR